MYTLYLCNNRNTGKTIIEIPPEYDRVTFLEQYVVYVNSFSSQYGSDTSISYTAFNINGKPSKFPDYGDFPQAFVMRTYGKWWDEAPSRSIPFMPQSLTKITSQDYIDLEFEEAVYPFRVAIYEIYNPGSVVRIWAADCHIRWHLLYEGEPRKLKHTANLFCPVLRTIGHKTQLLRLEFDHSHLDYYTELDAVLLVGSKAPLVGHSDPSLTPEVGSITSAILQCNIHNIPAQVDIPSSIEEFLRDGLPRFLQETEDPFLDDSEPSTFDSLPDEIVLVVMGFLDLLSLCRCSQVSRRFLQLSTDPVLYSQLNLKVYWHCSTSRALQTLAPRCSLLRKLDLSWCGNFRNITTASFVDFIERCGLQLTHLRLNSCQFVTREALRVISTVCTNLRELGLGNCAVATDGFGNLSNLHLLENLNLYRTTVTGDVLGRILTGMPRLRHINLGACICIADMDEIAVTMASSNPALVSVDFWKTYTLTSAGIRALCACSRLQEVDLGWCLGVGVPGDSLQCLARSCPDLRKLFLAALRGVGDRDLEAFVELCPLLEQVDLLGLRSITPSMCDQMLAKCCRLRLLDVSFCDQIQGSDVERWRELYPAVSIKYSFQQGSFQHC